MQILNKNTITLKNDIVAINDPGENHLEKAMKLKVARQQLCLEPYIVHTVLNVTLFFKLLTHVQNASS